jgi:hypothetical protein
MEIKMMMMMMMMMKAFTGANGDSDQSLFVSRILYDVEYLKVK